jgi:uncharacterized protein
MLLRFTVSNYRSFKEEATLDLEACSIKEQAENVSPVKLGSQSFNILKSVVLLGANSSGKSNLFKGFALMRHLVINSVRETATARSYPIEPFLLSTETEHLPSKFECTVMIENIVYRYGFRADNDKVHAEYLYRIVKRKEEAIFIREGKDYQIPKNFSTSFKNKLTLLTDLVRADSLYLTVLAQFNIDFAQQIAGWFEKNIIYSELDLDNAIRNTSRMLEDPVYNTWFNQIISKSDIGFTEIEPNKKTDRQQADKWVNSAWLSSPKIKVSHIKYDARNKPAGKVSLELENDESSGSQKLIALLGPIIKSLIEGSTLWIDEFDSKIHPYVTSMLMSLFNSIKYNERGAQLISISYNQQILKKLRRDQIVFLNKDSYGASSVSALYIFNPQVRSNAFFDKEYLQGLYGGVPRINNDEVLEIAR